MSSRGGRNGWRKVEREQPPVIESGGLTSPDGFEQVTGVQEVWHSRETGAVIVLGCPEEDSGHDCDLMGCGQCHVLCRAHPQGETR